jgi:hypothetical protein
LDFPICDDPATPSTRDQVLENKGWTTDGELAVKMRNRYENALEGEALSPDEVRERVGIKKDLEPVPKRTGLTSGT